MKVVVVPYSPLWKQAFAEEKLAIEKTLKSLNVFIEHVGSTSVVGLAAKPIIDILVGLPFETGLDASITPMQQAGFTYNKKYEPMMPYRRYFVRYRHPLGHIPPALYDASDIEPSELGFNAATHIHIVTYNSDFWYRHIAFREYLKSHAEIRTEYEHLKLRLVQRDFEYKLQYSEAKSDFIGKVEAMALQWWKEKNRHERLDMRHETKK